MPTTNVPEVIAPAIDAYMAELDRHQAAPEGTTARCTCGWTKAKSSAFAAAVSSGQHATMAHKKASKACDVAMAELIAAAEAR